MTALALAVGAAATTEELKRFASNNPVAPRIPRRIASRREIASRRPLAKKSVRFAALMLSFNAGKETPCC
jgi:hypothetical protein